MELGATICVPNGAPLCTECPWKDFCEAKKQELIGQIPVKSKAKPRKIEKKTVLILRDDEKVAIRKRPAKGLLAGLDELPNVEGNMGQDYQYLFNHDDVETVYFRGFEDIERQEFIYNLTEFYKNKQ